MKNESIDDILGDHGKSIALLNKTIHLWGDACVEILRLRAGFKLLLEEAEALDIREDIAERDHLAMVVKAARKTLSK